MGQHLVLRAATPSQRRFGRLVNRLPITAFAVLETIGERAEPSARR
jgi:hypothetical protein